MRPSLLESVIVVDFHAKEAYSRLTRAGYSMSRGSVLEKENILQCELSLAVPLYVNKGNQHDNGKNI
jgi:hypothetical protein